MNTKRLQAILLVSTLTLLALIILALALNRPAPNPPPIINITRQEYDAAYNRWRLKAAVEYRITTRQVTTSTDCLTRATIGKEQTTMMGEAECAHKAGYFTVEALLDAIDERLDAAQSPSDQDRATTWSVDLDPEMGFPRSLVIELAPLASTPNAVLTSTTTVENIEILKVGTPATPTKP